jgi:hypothetical protein
VCQNLTCRCHNLRTWLLPQIAHNRCFNVDRRHEINSRGEQVLDRRSAVEYYRNFAVRHGLVNSDASEAQMDCDGSSSKIHATPHLATRLCRTLHNRDLTRKVSPFRRLDRAAPMSQLSHRAVLRRLC